MQDTVLRGDLGHIRCGQYCYLGARTVLRPPYKTINTGLTYFPMRLGDRVVIDEVGILHLRCFLCGRIIKDCVVMAAEICNSVYIERDCVIGQSVVIKDCCLVTRGSVLSADMIVPPFSIVSGNPGRSRFFASLTQGEIVITDVF